METSTTVELPEGLVFDPAMLDAYDPSEGFPDFELKLDKESCLKFLLAAKDQSHPLSAFISDVGELINAEKELKGPARDEQNGARMENSAEEVMGNSFLTGLMEHMNESVGAIERYRSLRDEIKTVMTCLTQKGCPLDSWPLDRLNLRVQAIDSELLNIEKNMGREDFIMSMTLTRAGVRGIMGQGSDENN